MKKPSNNNIIKKGLNFLLGIFILFLLVTTTNDQTQNMFQPVEDSSITHNRIDYWSHPYLGTNGKAKTVQSGSGSSFEVQETFNGYNSSSSGNTLNTFNNPTDRTSVLDIINPTNYQKQSGTITVANITAENDWREIESNAESPIVMLGGAISNPKAAAMELTITDTTVNVVNINLYYETHNWALETVTLEIRNESAGTVSDNIIESVNMVNVGSTPIWYGYSFTTSLVPDTYYVVVNASELSGTSYSLTWWGESDSGNDDNGNVFVWDGAAWESRPSTWDLALKIQVLPIEGGNPKTYSADEVAMNVTYDINSVSFDSSNSISFGDTLAETFTFDTNVSVSFDIAFNIIFEREQTYSVISKYLVNSEQDLADWNCTFTSSSITLENYDISNRTFSFTCPTDWGIDQVYNNSIPYVAGHYGVSGFGSFWINASTSIVGSAWRIDANSPNYVVEVWVINATTLQNLTEAHLGQQIGVNTQLHSGYTSTLNTLNITLLDSTSVKVNSTWLSPTSNPYNVKYTLNTTWSSGIYTIKSFYYNETEVGLETTILTVYTPTYLSQETEFTTSNVMIGDPVYFAIYYNDSLQNQAVTDASVIMSPDWASSPTISYNSTYGFYQTSIETSGAHEGTHTITVNASRQFYCSQNNIQFNIQLVSPPPMDVTPPTTTIEFSGTQGMDGWYISDVTVMLSATDDLSGVTDIAYSFDGVNWNIYTDPFPITTEGRSTIFYNSIDGVDNVETTKTATIKIDKTPPETKISLDCMLGLEGWYVSDDVIVTLTATDTNSNVAQTAYSTDGVNWNTYTEPFVITTEGETSVYYHSTDVASNVEATKTESIKIDTTLPNTTLMLGSPYVNDSGTLYVTDTTEFTLTATDVGSGVVYTSYRINGGEWINYIDPFTLVGPDSTYYIDYNSTDTAGNIELTNTTMVILETTPPIDTIPPVTTLMIGEPKYVTDITYVTPETPFTLEVNDEADLGANTIVYRIYPGTDDTSIEWILYTAPFRLTSLTDGTYTIEFYSTDQVGNMETPQSIQVTLFTWDYVFTDSYGRGTILKINTEYELFQFIAPNKDYGIRKATLMRERVYCRYIIKRHYKFIRRTKRIIHHTIYIKYKDDELRLTALVNPIRDSCVAIAWEVQVGKPYILKDIPGKK